MLKIYKAKFIYSVVNKNNWIKDNIKEICLIGRSNVGKSSFINILTNNYKLSKTSKIFGKTKMLNFFSINNDLFRIIDTPGYSFTKINKKYKNTNIDEMLYEYLTIRKNLYLVCLLIDLRRFPNKDDIFIYKLLKYKKIKVLIIGTKLDKLKKNDINKQIKNIKFLLNLKKHDILIIISNKLKIGHDKCLKIFKKYIFAKIIF